jgi:Zn-finger nucleic acid-binding protein
MLASHKIKCIGDQVLSKINLIKADFVAACDWKNNTGQGIIEQDGEEEFEKAMEKRYPYYKALEEVMGSRVNIKPPVLGDTGDIDKFINELSSESEEEYSDEDRNSDDHSENSNVQEKKRKLNKSKKKAQVVEIHSGDEKTSNVSKVQSTRPLLPIRTKYRSNPFSVSSPFAVVDQERLKLDQSRFEREGAMQEKQMMYDERKLAIEERRAQYEFAKELNSMKLEVLRSRKTLLDEGIPQEEIDALFPLHDLKSSQ